MKNSSHLDVNVYMSPLSPKTPTRAESKTVYDFLQKVNYQVLSNSNNSSQRENPSSKRNLKSLSRTIKWTTDVSGHADPAHFAIKQIISRSFEDDPLSGQNDSYESFVSVNLNDSRLTTLRL